jgi:hypothetical protein
MPNEVFAATSRSPGPALSRMIAHSSSRVVGATHLLAPALT